MNRYSHVHNAWVICTQDDCSGDTHIQVLIPVGQKGYPGFEIEHAKIKGDVIWGHGTKKATDDELIENITRELEEMKFSLERIEEK